MSPDDRAKAYADRNRPLKLEDQRHDMEVEKQRRQYEESVYKSRAGDVATWITEIENQRKKHNLYGAHLPHTNVTRDKINLEYARRNINLQARNYHDELGLQQEERHRTTKLIKLKDDVAGIEHTRKWDDWVISINLKYIIKLSESPKSYSYIIYLFFHFKIENLNNYNH